MPSWPSPARPRRSAARCRSVRRHSLHRVIASRSGRAGDPGTGRLRPGVRPGARTRRAAPRPGARPAAARTSARSASPSRLTCWSVTPRIIARSATRTTATAAPRVSCCRFSTASGPCARPAPSGRRTSPGQGPHQAQDHQQREADPQDELDQGGYSCSAPGRDDLGDPDAEVLVDHDHLAPGDQPAVDQQVGRAAGGPVQLDDGARVEREQLAHAHPGAAQLGGDLHLDVVQHVEPAAALRLGGLPAGHVDRRRARRSATGSARAPAPRGPPRPRPAGRPPRRPSRPARSTRRPGSITWPGSRTTGPKTRAAASRAGRTAAVRSSSPSGLSLRASARSWPTTTTTSPLAAPLNLAVTAWPSVQRVRGGGDRGGDGERPAGGQDGQRGLGRVLGERELRRGDGGRGHGRPDSLDDSLGGGTTRQASRAP